MFWRSELCHFFRAKNGAINRQLFRCIRRAAGVGTAQRRSRRFSPHVVFIGRSARATRRAHSFVRPSVRCLVSEISRCWLAATRLSDSHRRLPASHSSISAISVPSDVSRLLCWRDVLAVGVDTRSTTLWARLPIIIIFHVRQGRSKYTWLRGGLFLFPLSTILNHWRPLNGRPGLRMAVSRRSGPVDAGLAYGLYRLYARSVCDMNGLLEMVSGRYAILYSFNTCFYRCMRTVTIQLLLQDSINQIIILHYNYQPTVDKWAA